MKCFKVFFMVAAVIVAAVCGYYSEKPIIGILSFAATFLPVIIWFLDNKENQKRDDIITDVNRRSKWRNLDKNISI